MTADFIQKISTRASASKFYLFLLNLILDRAIPFNRPHRVRIISIAQGQVTTSMPFIKRNRNHVGSVHACGLAALCEFTSGISVMTCLTSNEYRIVLKSLKVDYHFRAKSAVTCSYSLDEAEFARMVVEPLTKSESVEYDTTSQVFDHNGNLICTGKATWQIKKWDKVRSK